MSALRERLQTLGELAAGIAHEVASPLQFVGDNTRYLAQAFVDLARLVDALETVETVARSIPSKGILGLDQALARAARVRDELDHGALMEEIPAAIEDTLAGIEQVSCVAQAVKRLSHPGGALAPLDVNAALRRAVMVSRPAWKCHAEMALEAEDEIPDVRGDEGPLIQALTNLIVNAGQAIATHRPVGERGRIATRTRSIRHGTWVEVEIEDDGPGIPPDIQPRIFERFYTTKAPGQGTGQGLAVVWSVVVERHGGTVHVESAPSGGTRFRLRLPVSGPL